jgi:hypothetical protein
VTGVLGRHLGVRRAELKGSSLKVVVSFSELWICENVHGPFYEARLFEWQFLQSHISVNHHKVQYIGL